MQSLTITLKMVTIPEAVPPNNVQSVLQFGLFSSFPDEPQDRFKVLSIAVRKTLRVVEHESRIVGQNEFVVDVGDYSGLNSVFLDLRPEICY